MPLAWIAASRGIRKAMREEAIGPDYEEQGFTWQTREHFMHKREEEKNLKNDE